MMNLKKRFLRAIALTALLTLLATALPALAATSYQAKVTADSVKVYAAKSPYKYLGSLPKGTEVTVKDVNGDAALISVGGKSGIVKLSALAAIAEETKTQTATGKTVVTTQATKIYKKASTSSSSAKLAKGTQLTLLGASGSFAKVSYSGKTGYVKKAHLAEPGDETQETAPETVVTTQATKIYKKASTSSSSAKLAKGTQLTLLGASGSFAKVSYSGKTGYVKKAHLAAATATETPEAEPLETVETVKQTTVTDVFSGSNEEIVYKFCVKEIGLNKAAACGIVANVRYESDFRPTLYGDGGTSYGICQWHAARRTSLINWCESNNYDYTTLRGQLYYLKYDLKTNYASVYKYLKEVDDTAEGAYDAGYFFCYNFEAPAARTSQSTARGNYAQKTLYPKY